MNVNEGRLDGAKVQKYQPKLPAEKLVESTEPAAEKEPVTGVVTGCLRLNLRKEPDSDAEVLTELQALTELVVDLDESTDTFYKVCTSAGIQGFCMKEFVALRR